MARLLRFNKGSQDGGMIMTRFARAGCMAVLLAGVAATQDKGGDPLYAASTEFGVEIRAPRSSGKDQLWVAETNGKFYKDGVSVSHKVDNFAIEVHTQRLADPMKEKWPDKMTEVAKNIRANFLKENKDGTPSQWKECRVIEEDPKAKLPSLSGKCASHKIALIDQKDGKKELLQYFCNSSEVMYYVTVSYDADGFKKYWAREGQVILASIKRSKYEKPK